MDNSSVRQFHNSLMDNFSLTNSSHTHRMISHRKNSSSDNLPVNIISLRVSPQRNFDVVLVIEEFSDEESSWEESAVEKLSENVRRRIFREGIVYARNSPSRNRPAMNRAARNCLKGNGPLKKIKWVQPNLIKILFFFLF